jgi:hypothetical protein
MPSKSFTEAGPAAARKRRCQVPHDAAYWRARAERERQRAACATDAWAEAIHLKDAERFEAMANRKRGGTAD